MSKFFAEGNISDSSDSDDSDVNVVQKKKRPNYAYVTKYNDVG